MTFLLGFVLLQSAVLSSDAERFPQRDELLRHARRTCAPTALGVYIQDRKAGWMLVEGRIDSRDGRDVLVLDSEDALRITFEGEEASSLTRTRTTYSLDDGALLAIEEHEEEDGTVTETSASRDAGGFRVITRGQGYERERHVDPPRVGPTEELRFESWLATPPRAGEVFEMLELDLDADALVVTTEIRYLEPCRALVNGNLLPGHRLAVQIQGMEMEATVLSDFRFVAGGIPGLMEFRLADPAKVRELEEEGAELPSHVPCDEALGDPESVAYLELELDGARSAVPVDRRQHVEEREGPPRIRVWRDPEDDPGSPLTEDEVRLYTSATGEVQSDHPRIVERARALGAGSRSRRDAARAVVNWVYGMLAKTYAKNASTAVDVLANGSGDCSEHALLFTALARALGIPTRIVGGIMYAGDELGGFAWHAWCEFHDGERWIAVDPTWRQMPVDATHVKLDEDALDGDMSWVRSLGRLEIWVVDAERD